MAFNYWACLLAVAVIGVQPSSAAEKPDPAVACAGFELFVEKVKTCEGVDSHLTLDKFNVTLLDNCTFAPSGAVDYKSFSTAKLDYDINFASAAIIKKLLPDVPLSYKDFDLCNLTSIIPQSYMHYFTDLGVPTTCPVEGKKVIADSLRANILHDLAKQHNIRPYLTMAVTTGRTTGKVTVRHENGQSTCIEFGGAIRKKLSDKARRLQKKALSQIAGLKDKMKKKPTTTPATTPTTTPATTPAVAA